MIAIVREKALAKTTANNEARAFFVKMVGDYYRYMAEAAGTGERFEVVKQEAYKAYSEANEISLPPCSPVRLGLSLNFSVFYYEVMKDHRQAIVLADEALQAALEKIDELNEDDFKDAKSIIELLKENLILWKEHDADRDEE